MQLELIPLGAASDPSLYALGENRVYNENSKTEH